MRLYTGRGDRGETDLRDGKRAKKGDLRIEAYGTVDELNSALGIARLHVGDEQVSRILFQIQEKLFILGSELASTKGGLPQITEGHVRWIEGLIEGLEPELRSVEKFVFPGGSPPSAHLHLCRAICRRMERRIQALSMREPVSQWALAFSNRLSSLLFGLALLMNQRLGVEEAVWRYEG